MTYAEFKQNAPDWMHDEFITDFQSYRHNTQTVEDYWSRHAEYWIGELEMWNLEANGE